MLSNAFNINYRTKNQTLIFYQSHEQGNGHFCNQKHPKNPMHVKIVTDIGRRYLIVGDSRDLSIEDPIALVFVNCPSRRVDLDLRRIKFAIIAEFNLRIGQLSGRIGTKAGCEFATLVWIYLIPLERIDRFV